MGDEPGFVGPIRLGRGNVCVTVDNQVAHLRNSAAHYDPHDDGSKLGTSGIIRLHNSGDSVKSALRTAAAIGLLIGGAGTAPAHHAFTAQYDPDDEATLTGVVVKIEWLNPHAYFFIDVTDDATGEVRTWACELTSPVGLMRRGWTRNSLSIGDVVEVEGALARDGGQAINAASVVLTGTGQRLFTRSAAEERQVSEASQ